MIYEKTSRTVNGITISKTNFTAGGGCGCLVFVAIIVAAVIMLKSCAAPTPTRAGQPLHKPSEDAAQGPTTRGVGEAPQPLATITHPAGMPEVKP